MIFHFFHSVYLIFLLSASYGLHGWQKMKYILPSLHLEQLIVNRSPSMKPSTSLLLLALATACSPEQQSSAEIETTNASGLAPASFVMRNKEIRNDILRMLLEENITHRLTKDGSIEYQEVDGNDIDRIIYYAVGQYAARN